MEVRTKREVAWFGPGFDWKISLGVRKCGKNKEVRNFDKIGTLHSWKQTWTLKIDGL